MNIVFLSGGSGKRLWPLSNDVRSKQFIKILKAPDGSYESMLQRMYREVMEVAPDADVTITTSANQVSPIRNQIGVKAGISVEPCRRDTFPAIALACMFLKDVRNLAESEPVVVCPVDPFVEKEYFEGLKHLSEIQGNPKEKANITLMGIEPTYPSEKYGYIIPKDKEALSEVTEFKEKPDEETAKKYIEQGALWNAGVFAFKLGYLVNKAHELIDFKDYYDLLEKYESVEKISFDYAVLEKEKNINVTRFNGEWRDLGTWNTLVSAMEENTIGKAIMADTCENVHILNELDVPVLALGLKDVVISASPEGILVTDKHQSSYMKPYVDKIHQEIMFAEKSWGEYKVIDVEDNSLTIRVTLHAGHKMNYHSHELRDEVWTVVEGEGIAVINGRKREVGPGEVIHLPRGCKHSIKATTELKVIEVQMGDNIKAEDKIRYEYKWE
jgi:mannose-1-phosphate guanylyltransferase